MIIKTWVLLAIISSFAQVFLAIKKFKHYIGFFIPSMFLLFGIYAWIDLSGVGISMAILLSFMIPPVFCFVCLNFFIGGNVGKKEMIIVYYFQEKVISGWDSYFPLYIGFFGKKYNIFL